MADKTAAWTALEAASPALSWRRVAVGRVEDEIAAARAALAMCRARAEDLAGRLAAD